MAGLGCDAARVADALELLGHNSEGQNTGKRARAPGRLAKTDIASNVGRLTNAIGLVRAGNHREVTGQSLKACTIRIHCPTAMNFRDAW